MFQGIGIGGEWGGAVLMSIEHSPNQRRGYYGAWPQIGVPAGMCLSAGVVSLITAMTSAADFAAWGWRIAFLLSAVLVVVGLYIRLKIFETPAFQKMKEAKKEAVADAIRQFNEPARQLLEERNAQYYSSREAARALADYRKDGMGPDEAEQEMLAYIRSEGLPEPQR